MDICKNCKSWNKFKDSVYRVDMGECLKISASNGEEYPDENTTGINGTPICSHDGMAVLFETKSWFGCIHFIKTK